MRITIMGAGNIGAAIANGVVKSGRFPAEDITLTRRRIHLLDGMKEQGFTIEGNNQEAVRQSEVVVIAVEPQRIDDVLKEIAPSLEPDKHIIISVVPGVSTGQIINQVGKQGVVVRA